jgi:hypothetical protein
VGNAPYWLVFLRDPSKGPTMRSTGFSLHPAAGITVSAPGTFHTGMSFLLHSSPAYSPTILYKSEAVTNNPNCNRHSKKSLYRAHHLGPNVSSHNPRRSLSSRDNCEIPPRQLRLSLLIVWPEDGMWAVLRRVCVGCCWSCPNSGDYPAREKKGTDRRRGEERLNRSEACSRGETESIVQ